MRSRVLAVRARKRAALFACAALAAAAAVAPLALDPEPRLVWNASASAPIGLWRVRPGAPVAVGDRALAVPPPAARALAARRGYLPANVPLLKSVAAANGDLVCADGPVLAVNGRPVAMRRAADRHGRPLPWWSGCRRLAGGAVLLLNPAPDSFDGRYFGPVERSAIIGKGEPAMAAVTPPPVVAPADPAAARVAAWTPIINEAAQRFGVPAAWIAAVMRAESGGRTQLSGRPIVSPAGAIGLMQVMPATYAELAARHGLGPDPHDPRDNIMAGAAYLAELHRRFGYPGLFAAYNAGPARYAEHLAGRGSLPAETRAYLTALSASPPAGDMPPAVVSGTRLFFVLSAPAAPLAEAGR